jgi:pentatricopeptide repeat protein
MREEGLEPDSVAHNAAIDACAKGGQALRAMELLEAMKVGFSIQILALRSSDPRLCYQYPNLVSFNSALDACAKEGKWSWALSLLDRMRGLPPSLQPNLISYNTAIDACARQGRSHEALDLLTELKHRGLEPDDVTYNSAMRACGRAGEWRRAMDLLAEMRSRDKQPGLVTYNTAISACAQSGRADEALALLEECGALADVVTYNAAILACSNAKRHAAATRLLQVMRARGLAPDAVSYTSAMRGAGVQQALELVQRMRGEGITVAAVTYNAVLRACVRESDSRTALGLLDDMDAVVSATLEEMTPPAAHDLVRCGLWCSKGCGPGRGELHAGDGGVRAREPLARVAGGAERDDHPGREARPARLLYRHRRLRQGWFTPSRPRLGDCSDRRTLCQVNDWNKALLLLRDVGFVGQARECYERAMVAFGKAGEWEKVLWLLERSENGTFSCCRARAFRV